MAEYLLHSSFTYPHIDIGWLLPKSPLPPLQYPLFPLLLSIPPLPRDHPFHTALRIIHIPGIPRNNMHVQVHHALGGRRPDIQADVIAVGGIELTCQPTGIVDEGEEGGLLGNRQLLR